MLKQVLNQVFKGVVISSTAGSHTVTVVRESYATRTNTDAGFPIQGTVVSSVMTAFLGFKESAVLQPGSRVLCVAESSHTCYVLGVIPDQDVVKKGAPLQFANRAALGAGCASDDTANKAGHQGNTAKLFNSRRPSDEVDGEHVIGNEFGVLLGLYQELANLKASELAQVQCFLLDDLVRIISHNFQHYTALGEYNIYHDGKRLMAEFGATHKPAESYGRPAVESESSESIFSKEEVHSKKDTQDFYKVNEDDRIKAIERFKLFLGSVGDFINLFVVRPNPSEVRKLAPEGSNLRPDTGLCNLHVGTDGGVHLRSLKEVFIEKTNWIRVPLRVAAPEDPNGDSADTLSYEIKKPFKFNNQYTYKKNPFNFALQIRDYVAYVNEKLNYQNFKSHKKDFYVNDSIDREENISKIDKIDAETSLGLQEYVLRTAGIYLMPNGGITIKDAWNSSIVMEGGNIYIQPAKDLITQPLRNHISKVGGSFNLACQKYIDISSSSESMRIKTEKVLHLYSNSSGILMEANGENESVGNGGTEAIEDIGGIVLKSKLNIYNYAKKDLVSYAHQNIHFQAISDLNFVADNSLNLYGKQSLYSFTDNNYFLYSKQNAKIITGNGLIMAGQSQTTIGQKDSPVNVQTDPGVSITGVVKVKEILAEKDLQKYIDSKKELLKLTPYNEKEKFDELKFKFLSSDKYKVDSKEDAIPSTLAQQDDIVTDMYSLKEWEETEINESLPYPGKDFFEKFLFTTEALKNLEKKSTNGEDLTAKAESSNTPAEIKLESLNKYKVQSTQK